MELKIPYTNITDKAKGYEEAKKRIPEVIQKFGVKADVKTDDANHSFTAKGTGFEAKLHFQEKEVVVTVDLGFLLKPLKGKITEVIEKQIKKVV
ncbi:MAG: polyhydroxyalkanoic acid system family protein [Bdellovibrionota bacterium]